MTQFIITGYLLWAFGSYMRDHCTVAAVKGNIFGVVLTRCLNVSARVVLLGHIYATFI